jgi:glycosyltransferase involved in cell wall biosynthesis
VTYYLNEPAVSRRSDFSRVGEPPQMTSNFPSALQGNPLVSVVIPAYNTARYIPATLNSVLSQTIKEFEILVINDGSPDTPDLEFALKPYGSRIRYIKQENRGPSAARNAGIREARGKYVAFLDSDDLWFPEHLANQLSALERDPSLGLIYSNGIHVEDEQPISISFERTPQLEPVTFESLLREDSTVGTSGTVAFRQALLEAGLFDEGLRRCEDFDLWLRMAHRGVRMTFTRNIQIYHRLANGLAGNPILMKQARADVYRRAGLLPNITESQQQTIERKISEIEHEIQLEIIKELLLSGRYDDSRRAAQQAARTAPTWKLRAVVIGLRFFPGLVQTLYRFHLQRVSRQKRAESIKKLAEAGKFDLGHFERAACSRSENATR